jgi:hypothetical protein
MDNLEVSGGMLGSASAELDSSPLSLPELIKSSIKRASHATAIVDFKGRFSKDTQYSLYFVSNACGLTQHLCLVDKDRDNPAQVAVLMADRNSLKDLREACDKSIALIDAMSDHEGPMGASEELEEKHKDWPKEGWYEGTGDCWHYCKMTSGSEVEGVCDNFSSIGAIKKLLKVPKGKKCPDCIKAMK